MARRRGDLAALTAPYDAVVIGGGINGLCAAFHLHARGCRRLALVERFAVGHARGGSHGASRIIRGTYADPLWVALARLARAEAWPAIEAALGRRLIHPRPTFFFGPAEGAITDYAAAVASAGAAARAGMEMGAGTPAGLASDIVDLSPRAARRACPSLRFGDDDIVLWDLGGGFIAAAEALAGLAARLRAGGADLFEDTLVEAITAGASPLAVVTDRGTLVTERLVIAAGAWTGRLLPWLAPRLTVLRQTVGYFRIAGDAAALPVWARIGRPGEPFVYGLPAFGRPGLKAAIHRTTGRPDDPDDNPRGGVPARQGEADLDGLHRLVSRYLPVLGIDHAETCLYTMLPDDAFLLDRHPEDPRIVIAVCCSGHAFKLGPLTGRIAADLALGGRSDVAVFAEHRARFGVG